MNTTCRVLVDWKQQFILLDTSPNGKIEIGARTSVNCGTKGFPMQRSNSFALKVSVALFSVQSLCPLCLCG